MSQGAHIDILMDETGMLKDMDEYFSRVVESGLGIPNHILSLHDIPDFKHKKITNWRSIIENGS